MSETTDKTCPIGAEPWSTCPEDREECCAAVCPYYHPEVHRSYERDVRELKSKQRRAGKTPAGD